VKTLFKEALKDVPWLILGFIVAKIVSQQLSSRGLVKLASGDPVSA